MQNQKVDPEPLPALDRGQARELTDSLRAAIADVQRAGAVLAARVREAHRARIWLSLGYPSWGDYARGELGISRAHAYRLVEISGTAHELLAAADELGLSLAGDVGLSGRALLDLQGRVDEVAAVLADRIRAAGPGGIEDPAALVRDVVAGLRSRAKALSPSTDEGDQADDDLAAARRIVEQWRHNNRRIGELVLELAPAYLSDADVEPVLLRFAYDIGLEPDVAMACRRYAITGDQRCLDDVG